MNETETVKIIGIDVPITVFTAWEYEQFIRAKHESGRLEEEKARLNQDNLSLELALDRELLRVMIADFAKKSYAEGEDALSPEATAKAKLAIMEFEEAIRLKQDLLNERNAKEEMKDLETMGKWRTLWAHRVLAPTLNFKDFETSLTPEDKAGIYTLWEKKGFFAGA